MSATIHDQSEILILAPTGQDAVLISGALDRERIASQIFSDIESLIARALSGAGALVIADEALTASGIQMLNDALAKQEPWSDLPLIVMTSPADSQLASLRIYRAFSPSGNISLLERPFRALTLVSVVQVALRARQRQYQVKQLLEDQVKATSIRDEFISIASHELKTPLTALKLQSQITKRFADGTNAANSRERVTRLIEMTNTQVDRLTRLVEDMLDVSRINSKKLVLQKSQFDLGALVSEVLDRFGHQLETAGCLVDFYAEPELIGQWDRYRLEQVVCNLLTNAIRYAAGKPLHLKAYRLGDQAVLEVRDEGKGVAPEDRERIFQRFERAVVSNNISGLGLGLYICRHILESHQGSISVESELGQGATFIVKLPLDLSVAQFLDQRPAAALG